jgi:hypothetical protein
MKQQDEQMNQYPPVLNGLQVIPEDVVVFCASQFGPDEDNSFKNILNAADEFRVAGLTPLFLCTKTLQDIFVTTVEKLQKKYH